MIKFIIFLIIVVYINLTNVTCDPKRVKFNKISVDYGNQIYSIEKDKEHQSTRRILLSVSVKNYAHSLPTFLATLETLDCPTVDKKCDLR